MQVVFLFHGGNEIWPKAMFETGKMRKKFLVLGFWQANFMKDSELSKAKLALPRFRKTEISAHLSVSNMA